MKLRDLPKLGESAYGFRMKLALAVLIAVASTCALAQEGFPQAELDLRETASEVLQTQATIHRAASNCRYIRGVDTRESIATWNADNADFVAAARRVFANQGGLTTYRKAVFEAVAGLHAQQHSGAKEACLKLEKDIKAGLHDLSTTLPAKRISALLSTKPAQPSNQVWIIELRRTPDGTLKSSARPYEGQGGIDACEDALPIPGHLWTRVRVNPDGNAKVDTDPEMWLAQCASHGDQVK